MVGKVTRKGGTSFIAGGKKESSDDLFIFNTLIFIYSLSGSNVAKRR